MVTMNQIKAGIIEYADQKVLPAFPDGSWKGPAVGAFIGLAVPRLDKMLEALKENPYFAFLAPVLGVIDDQDHIDIQSIKDNFVKNMKHDVVIDLKITELSFSAKDIEELYETIIKQPE